MDEKDVAGMLRESGIEKQHIPDIIKKDSSVPAQETPPAPSPAKPGSKRIKLDNIEVEKLPDDVSIDVSGTL